MNSQVKRGLVFAGILAGSLLATDAFAVIASGSIDVSGATDIIDTDGETALTDVGGSMLSLAGLAIVFKWAKGAIFG